MRHDTRNGERGFSVLEALVTLALFVILMAVMMSVYTPSRLIYTRGERKTDVQQNARLAMSEMARQVRMAGFFPENFSSAPPSPALSDAVLLATDDFLVIHGDADGSGATNAFAFCRDGDLLRRGRAAADADEAFTCTGDIIAENVTDLRFTYYDVDGNAVPSPPAAPYDLDDQSEGDVPELTDVAERESVRRVTFTLTVEAETSHGEKQTYHLTSDVWLRNVS